MPYRVVALSLLVVVSGCAVRGAEPPGLVAGSKAGAGLAWTAEGAGQGVPAMAMALVDGGRGATTVSGARATATAAHNMVARAAVPPSDGRQRPVRRVRSVDQADPNVTAARVLREVNAARRRAGAPPLRADPALTRAAQRYARELASRREIEHVSRTPGRRTFRQRIAAAGGRARVAGENLARLTARPATLPERAVRAWMRSPGHRHNMLDPTFRRTGIGVWLGSDGIWYIVQEFASAD